MKNEINPWITNTCRIGQGADCCKYLTIGGDGWHCMRVDPYDKAIIDTNWAVTEHTAQADNCEGREDLNNWKEEG